MSYQLVDADTRRSLRGNRITTATLALNHLYNRMLEATPDRYWQRDFLIVNEHGQPVPASVLRRLAKGEHERRVIAARAAAIARDVNYVRDGSGRFTGKAS